MGETMRPQSFDERGGVLVSRSVQVYRLSLEESYNVFLGISAPVAIAKLASHDWLKMNTFDWVKINTNFQFYSKEMMPVKGKWSIWKTVFFFLSPPLSICSSPYTWSVVRVDFTEEYIYIYIYIID